MPGPRSRTRRAGTRSRAGGGVRRVARVVAGRIPLLGAALDVKDAMQGPGKGGGSKRRSRSVFMRKGRVFVGYSAKEVKRALRRKAGAVVKK